MKLPLKIILPLLVVLIIAGSIGSAYFFYTKYQTTKQLLENPTAAAKEETKILVDKVGKLIILPEGEDPSIATILDAEKLREQPFFSKAKNGDKVLIYANAQKAILYNPAENKIVDMAPLNIGSQNVQGANTTPTEAPVIRIAVYNGTQTTGLSQNAEKLLKQKFVNLEVVSKDNAAKNDYSTTTVVDLTGKNTALAQSLATEFNAQVVSLPEGEKTPEPTDGSPADILIILGADFTQ